MAEKHILALDASTKRTGYAIYTGKDEKIEYGVITSASQFVEKRISIMRDGILNLIKKYNIDTIIIEDVRPDGYNNQTAKVLLWLQGVVAVSIWEYNSKIKFEMIGPSSWRKILNLTQGRGVTRDKQKQIDIKYAADAFNVSLTASQDDEADALCILAAYLKDAQSLTTVQPATALPPIGSEESAF